MNILGLESEPLCLSQKSLLLHCQGKFPGDFCINIAYLADRRHEEVANTGKLPQQPKPNQIWQVYSEVAIQMCRGHREWLLDQLFPITVTVVNCIPRHMHLCIWVGEENAPNICRMINLTTLPQIRDWMSSCALSGYITIPGQLLTVGSWQIDSCEISEMTKRCFLFKFVAVIYHCIHSYASSHHSLSAARHRHGLKHLFSWRCFLLSFSCSDIKHQTWVTSRWFCQGEAQDVQCLRLQLVFVLKVLGSNYSESNC